MIPPSLLFHGSLRRPSSFSLINRRIVAGLRRKGWPVTVFPTDRQARRTPPNEPPHIYLFHDYPYDLLNATGRVNAFILNYEYARFLAADRSLASRLNGHFDLLFVPSRFVERVCRRNGVRIPIHVCPWGADPGDIHPGRGGRPARAGDPFRFLYLGGATERKGCDLLLRAYLRAFRNEDVTLTIKAFSYDHLLPWMRDVMAAAGVGRPGAPRVRFEHGSVRSVGKYYRAADAGVFPFRGEGFGLPILECLASGRPVIVTRGGGPLDFCRSPFARFIRARMVDREGKRQLQPDVQHLIELMREAFARGRPDPGQQSAIARSVSAFTWDRTVDVLDRALRSAKPRGRVLVRRNRRRAGAPPDRQAAFAYFETGRTSWRYTARKIDACLRRHFMSYLPLPESAPRVEVNAGVLVGQSGFCLERFIDARRQNPACRLVLYRESGPFEVLAAIKDRECRLLGVAPPLIAAMDRWTHRRECDLADRIVVLSEASRRLFIDAHYPETRLRVVRPGITVGRLMPARRERTIRFLFVGTDPFRKGIRLLLAAWDRLRPRLAELLVVVAGDVLQSAPALRYLVRNPSIRIMPFVPHREFQRLYETIDCQVLPTLEDGFSMAVSEGMGRGRPAIVSRAAGVSEIIEHGRNGLIVKTGSVDGLADAIEWVCGHRTHLAKMGEAAHDTARRYSWARFERRLVECVEDR